mmetsp:Transcript_26213/g.30053  ORF Transcript_26213/g.30053 Transcript_26213/m.30053 type:complete len:91 (-) Transcript_26213:474-746(-)
MITEERKKERTQEEELKNSEPILTSLLSEAREIHGGIIWRNWPRYSVAFVLAFLTGIAETFQIIWLSKPDFVEALVSQRFSCLLDPLGMS